MRISPAILSVLLLTLAAGSAATAQDRAARKAEELRSRPIEITADRLFADSGKNKVTFEGSVVAKQGDVVLTSDRLFAEYARESGVIDRITAEGNVHVSQEGREAHSANAVFYNMEQRIVLSGGAELVQGANVLKGETVTIFLRENRSVVTGGETGRVKAVIQPKGLSDTKGKEKETGKP